MWDSSNTNSHLAACSRQRRSSGIKRAPRRLKRTLCIVGLLLTETALVAAEPPAYRLIDSGFPSNELLPPFWVDNERVIFKGVEVGTYSKEMHESPPSVRRAKGYDDHGMRTGYFVWDTTNNAVTLYKDKIANLCIEDGNVVYRMDAERPIVWLGKLGEEQPADIKPPQLDFNHLRVNCWDRWPERTEAQKGRHILTLRSGWGYLDLGRSDPPRDLKKPVLFYREGQTHPIDLQIPVGNLINAGYVRFVPHENRHLIVEGNVSKERDAWFMSRDGRLTEVILPNGPWSGERLYPVKGGIFLSSSHTKGRKTLEPGGAYLIRDGEWWKLLFAGIKGRAGVSPNGCKVALVVAPDDKALRENLRQLISGRPGRVTMRMINVCKGDKQ